MPVPPVVLALAQGDARHAREQEGGEGRAGEAQRRGGQDARGPAAEAEGALDGLPREGGGGGGGEARPEGDFAEVVREAAASSVGQPRSASAVGVQWECSGRAVGGQWV